MILISALKVVLLSLKCLAGERFVYLSQRLCFCVLIFLQQIGRKMYLVWGLGDECRQEFFFSLFCSVELLGRGYEVTSLW